MEIQANGRISLAVGKLPGFGNIRVEKSLAGSSLNRLHGFLRSGVISPFPWAYTPTKPGH